MTAVRKLRVGVLDHTAVMSGAEVALRRFLPLLDPDRIDAVVILFAAGPLVDSLRQTGVQVHVAPMDAAVLATDRSEVGRASLRAARDAARAVGYMVQLARLIRRLQFDVVLTNSLKADLIGGIAARLTRTPVVWYVHDRISPDYLPARVARLMRWLARRIPRHVIANSEATLGTLLPLRDGAWTVAYPGLPDPAFSDPLRERPPEPPVVGMVGRISPTKGQDIFLRAAARIHATHPRVHFEIVGSALFNEQGFADDVHQLSAHLGLGDSVIFTGQVDDAQVHMRRFSVLVHASPVPEPFGQVVLEAMAAGIPVVATGAGGVVEIVGVEIGRYGVLVDPGDECQLADAVIALLDDPPRAAKMAERAREHARKSFTATATADAVAGALQDALTR